MEEEHALRRALRELGDRELEALARAADPFLVGNPLVPGGVRPNRLRGSRGLEFIEYRTYVPGDDPRNLDWRATVRRRQAQVRQFADEAHGRWSICLDRSASMAYPEPGKWLLAVQLCAAWAYLLIRAGHWVSLLTFDRRPSVGCQPGRAARQYHRILAYLAGAHPDSHAGGSDLERCAALVDRGSCALVISDFLAPDAMAGGLDLLAHGRVETQAIQVLSADECSCPAGEPVTLRDVETGAERTLAVGHDDLARARARLAALQGALAEHCKARRVRLTQCQTGELWSEVLLRHFAGVRSARV